MCFCCKRCRRSSEGAASHLASPIRPAPCPLLDVQLAEMKALIGYFDLDPNRCFRWVQSTQPLLLSDHACRCVAMGSSCCVGCPGCLASPVGPSIPSQPCSVVLDAFTSQPTNDAFLGLMNAFRCVHLALQRTQPTAC